MWKRLSKIKDVGSQRHSVKKRQRICLLLEYVMEYPTTLCPFQQTEPIKYFETCFIITTNIDPAGLELFRLIYCNNINVRGQSEGSDLIIQQRKEPVEQRPCEDGFT